MRFSYRAAAALLATALASDVHDLKTDTFKDFVSTNSLALIEFFAPWCGHCKALAPEYEEAATQLKEKNVALAKVDCTVEADLCREYGVEGYPTVKVFRGPDNIKPYQGARKAPAIVSYMTKQQLPAVSILTKDTLEEFKTTDKVVLVAYFALDDKTSNQTYSALAESLRDEYIFGATSDPELASAEGAKQPAVVLYKDFDEGKDVHLGEFTEEAIASFAKVASTPLVGEVGPETYQGYMAAGIPLAYIFSETAEERAELAKTLKPVAEKYKGKINFATIDAKAFGAHAGNLNLPTDKWPSFALQDTVTDQKYPFDGHKLTEKKIGAFVKEYVDGKLKPSVKSEPVPDKNDGPVTVLVATTFKELVVESSGKDVLVEFYAPWCGHCKALAPTYDQLGELYQSHDFGDKVVIAKVDATTNDVPEKIQGFPTIKLYPAAAKNQPVDYSGSRTLEDLANFIKDNGSNKVDVLSAQSKSSKDTEDDDTVMSDIPESMAKAAPAATESASGAAAAVKDAIKGAAEVVGTFIDDSDIPQDHHDEL
ncbi:protein disulfide-isomerase precursor [Lithohypha guttulata]|nr:protein disulfide-isomerase precursor [Lithohypha guttulata]